MKIFFMGEVIVNSKGLISSVNSSLISKFITLFSQLLILPLVINKISAIEFALFAMITGLSSWLSIIGAGIFPGVTRSIAKSKCNTEFVQIIISALTVISFIIVLFVFIFLIFGHFYDFSSFFSEQYSSLSKEITSAIYITMVLSSFQLLGALGDSIRLGLEQQNINNYFGIVANVTSLTLMVYVGYNEASLTSFVWATILPQAIFKIYNLSLVVIHALKLEIDKNVKIVSIHSCKELIKGGGIIALGGLAVALSQQGVIYVAGFFGSADDVALISVALRICTVLGGLVLMFTQPMSPILTKCFFNNNWHWFKTVGRYIFIMVFCYALSCGFIIAFLSNFILDFWINEQLKFSQTFSLFLGSYFLFLIINHVLYVALISFGKSFMPSIALLLESISVVFLSWYFISNMGSEGIILALMLSCLLVALPLNLANFFYTFKNYNYIDARKIK